MQCACKHLHGDRVSLRCDRVSLLSDHVSLHGDRLSLHGDRVSLLSDHVSLHGDRVSLHGYHMQFRVLLQTACHTGRYGGVSRLEVLLQANPPSWNGNEGTVVYSSVILC